MKISSISVETVSATAVHIHNGRKHVNKDLTFRTKKKKNAPERSLAPSTMEDTRRHLWPRREPSPGQAVTMILDS